MVEYYKSMLYINSKQQEFLQTVDAQALKASLKLLTKEDLITNLLIADYMIKHEKSKNAKLQGKLLRSHTKKNSYQKNSNHNINANYGDTRFNKWKSKQEETPQINKYDLWSTFKKRI